MDIRLDDLRGPEIAEFLAEHIRDMRSISPPESKHALDLEGLRAPTITFWSAWTEQRLVGCCALKELDPTQGELKSMRVARDLRGGGMGARLLEHAIAVARERRYVRLSLETGAMDFFIPARRLYTRYGFVTCGPFGDYRLDPNSVFMTLVL